MQVACPKCHRPIAGADIDLPTGRGVCRPCGELFPLPAASEAGTALALRESGPPPALFKPSGLQVKELPAAERSLALEVRGHHPPQALGMMAAGGASMTMSVVFGLMLLTGGAVQFLAPMCLMALIGSVLITVGASRAARRPRLHLGPDGFSYTGRRSVREPLANILRFADGPQSHNQASNVVPCWTVKLLTADGRAEELRLDLTNPDHARYLAAVLNRRLDELRAPAGYRE